MGALTYPEYKSKLRALVAEYGRQGIISGEIALRFVTAEGIPPKEGGVVLAMEPPLKFRDGATLSVLEEVRIFEHQATLLRYSYHYQRPAVTSSVISVKNRRIRSASPNTTCTPF